MNYINRFKDALPSDTVKKIKDIIANLGYETIEEWYPSGISNLFSVRVFIKNTNIAANGKGSMKEYALASGYAELIERLQNLINFRLVSNFFLFSEDLEFDISPDEVKHNSFDLNTCNSSWLNETFNNEIDTNLLLKKYFDLQEFNSSNDVIYIPFKDINNDSENLMPILLFDIVYGSNGMSAGNTKEEALVQGLSEIIERRVTCEILENKTSLPDITLHVKNSFPTINNIIYNIEHALDNNKNSLSVHIKDCSLGKNYPTIIVFIFDKNTKKYFASLGTHPSLEIAIERTLTEIMQGRNIDELNNSMSSLNEDFESYNFFDNRKRIFRNGEGIYPLSVLEYSENDTPKSNVWKSEFKSNDEMLKSLINIITTQGYKIYYRDSSFLGFNTYQVIVPGFSEINPQLFKELDKLIEEKKLRELYKNIDNLNEKELNEFAEILDQDRIGSEFSLNELFSLPLKEDNILNNITKDCLLIIVYTLLENYEKAYKTSIRFLDYISRSNADTDVVEYYKSISAFLYMKKDGFSNKNIENVLINFYEKEFISELSNDLNKNYVTRYLPKISCPNCSNCDIQQFCCFESDKSLYSKLMKQQQVYHNKIYAL